MKKYQLIYADPCWSYGNKISNGTTENHYETMSLAELKRLPVWNLAADDSVLAMWYTGTHANEARELAAAWGYDVRQMFLFTWVKLNGNAEQRFDRALAEGQLTCFYDLLDMLNAETKMNPGNYSRANQESCLIAVRGKGLERQSASVKQIIFSCLGQHSAKPAEARFRLEQLYGDVSRVELFARGAKVPGWDQWGNEAEESLQLVPGGFTCDA